MLSKISSKTLIGLIVFLCFIYLLISLLCRPVVSSDALNGFVSLHNYVNGGEWNKIINFNGKTSEMEINEMTWWAPGQYELPYLFSKLLNGNIACSISFLLFLSLTVGAILYYKIFKLYSTVSKKIVLVALTILLFQRFININFLQYSSSDLFLFFYVPIYILIYLKIQNGKKSLTWYNLLLLLLINIGGLFIKNSFLLFSAAFNIFLIFKIFNCARQEDRKQSVNNNLQQSVILIPFIISVILDYYFFLRLGAIPTNGAGVTINFSCIIQGLFQSIMGILFSSLSLTSMYGNLYGKFLVSDAYLNLIMFLCFIAVIGILYLNRRKIKALFKKDIFFAMSIIISLMYVMYWLVFNIKHSYISNEDRLFLPVTILILPYLVEYVANTSPVIKRLGILIIACSVLYGIGTMVKRIENYSNDKLSATSADLKLKSFKIFSSGKNDLNELSQLSSLISTRYHQQYLIATDMDVLFLLKVNNQFIYESPTTFSINVTDAKKYLLLLTNNNNVSLIGWKNIYKSNMYKLYISE